MLRESINWNRKLRTCEFKPAKKPAHVVVRAVDAINHIANRSAANALLSLPCVPTQELLEQGIAFRGVG
jgi:hypothetical protein